MASSTSAPIPLIATASEDSLTLSVLAAVESVVQPAAVLPFCRYCLESDPVDDLFTPCLCMGESKWVHRVCLSRWQRLRDTTNGAHRRCEICHGMFRMANVSGPTAEDNETGGRPRHIENNRVSMACDYSEIFGYIYRGISVLIATHLIFLLCALVLNWANTDLHDVLGTSQPAGINSEEVAFTATGIVFMTGGLLFLLSSPLLVAIKRAREAQFRNVCVIVGRTVLMLGGSAVDIAHTPLLYVTFPPLISGYWAIYINTWLPIPTLFSIVVSTTYRVIVSQQRANTNYHTTSHVLHVLGTSYVQDDAYEDQRESQLSQLSQSVESVESVS